MDRILTSIPINKQAAGVVSKGYRFEPVRKLGNHIRQWEVCPELGELAPEQDNLSGLKFGDFTVIGVLKDNPKKLKNSRAGRSRWVCRCVCGVFESRSRKAILNPGNNKDKCYSCRWLDDKKRYLNNKYAKRRSDVQA